MNLLTIKSTAIAVLLSTSLNAQTVEHGTPFGEYHKDLVGATTEELILWKQDDRPGVGINYVSEYKIINTVTGEEKEIEGEINEYQGAKGMVLQTIVEGEYSYELRRYITKGDSDAHVIISKRNLSNGKVEEDDFVAVNIFDNGSLYTVPYIYMQKGKDGIYVYSNTGNGYDKDEDNEQFFAKYSFDLNEEWKNELTDVEGLASYGALRVQDDGNILMTYSFKDEENAINSKSGQIVPTSYKYVVCNSEGEYSVIDPEMKSNFVFTYKNFYYDDKNKQLVGFYLISEVDDSKRKAKVNGQGYASVRWGLDGKEVSSNAQMLTYGDVWNDEAKAFLKVLDIRNDQTDDKPFPKITQSTINTFYRENGNLLVTFGSLNTAADATIRENGWLNAGNFMMELSPEGNLLWTQFIPRRKDGVHKKEGFYYKDGNLYIVQKDFVEFFNNGTYTMTNARIRATAETVAPVLVVIDCNDGTIARRELIENKDNPKFLYDQPLTYRAFKDGDKSVVYITYRNTRKNSVMASRLTF